MRTVLATMLPFLLIGSLSAETLLIADKSADALLLFDTDERQVRLNRRVFEIEDSLNPIHAMFLYRTIEKTGDIADMAERVGRRLEVLLSR